MAAAIILSSVGLDVVNTCVYEAVEIGPPADKLSALVVTSSGDVYGAGVNTLVRSYTYHDDYPMKAGAGPALENWVKIDRLSGLGIDKIIVGPGYGVALTATYGLLTWGSGMVNFFGKRAVVMVQEYRDGTECGICMDSHYLQPKSVGKQLLSYCNLTGKYPMYDSDNPPPKDTPVRKCIRFFCCDTRFTCSCLKSNASKLLNSVPLYYCAGCDRLWNVESDAGILGQNQTGSFPNRIDFHSLIIDIAPFSDLGIWLLTSENEILLRGFGKLPSSTETPISGNQKGLNFTSIYRCGTRVLVKTTTGELWVVAIRESGTQKNISVFSLDIEKICLPAPVSKICCGNSAVLCHLGDHTMWLIKCDSPPKQLQDGENGSWLVQSMASIWWRDQYFVQLEHPSQSKCLRDPDCVITFTNSNSSTTAMNLVCSGTIQNLLVESPQCPSAVSDNFRRISTPVLPQFLVSLYGQHHLSDLTFKLSNGEFPAHRSVLLSTSSYFHETLCPNTQPRVTLDVSSFNPDAYKCLLKYFYQREPDELDLDSLLDLYLIADGYGETEIAGVVEDKIKNKITTENVLHVFRKSMNLNLEKIRVFCENQMKSSNYKDWLLEKAMKIWRSNE